MERRDYVSISFLKNMLSEKTFKNNDKMDFGSLVDCLLYTPDLFHSKFYVNQKVLETIKKDEITDVIDKWGLEYFILNGFDKVITDVQSIDFVEHLSKKQVSNRLKKEDKILESINLFKELWFLNHNKYEEYIAVFLNNYEFNKNIKDKGLILVTNEDLLLANQSVENIKNSIHWQFLADKGGTQHYQFDKIIPVEILNTITNFRVILDHLIILEDKAIIIDLKCTDDKLSTWVTNIADKLRYDQQASFYVKAIQEMLGFDDVYFHWLVYSKKEEKTALFQASHDILQRGMIGTKWKKGWLEYLNVYIQSHEKGFNDYNLEYNLTNGFLKWQQ